MGRGKPFSTGSWHKPVLNATFDILYIKIFHVYIKKIQYMSLFKKYYAKYLIYYIINNV